MIRTSPSDGQFTTDTVAEQYQQGSFTVTRPVFFATGIELAANPRPNTHKSRRLKEEIGAHQKEQKEKETMIQCHTGNSRH
eukprot:gene23916-10054_t